MTIVGDEPDLDTSDVEADVVGLVFQSGGDEIRLPRVGVGGTLSGCPLVSCLHRGSDAARLFPAPPPQRRDS